MAVSKILGAVVVKIEEGWLFGIWSIMKVGYGEASATSSVVELKEGFISE